MKDNKEELFEIRRKVLTGFLIGFAIWHGMHIFNLLVNFPDELSYLTYASTIIGLIAWGFATINLFKMFDIAKKLKEDGELIRIVDNEYTKLNRLKAFTLSFFVVLGAEAFLLVLSIFYNIPVRAAINITIFVAVVTALIAFIQFDKSDYV